MRTRLLLSGNPSHWLLCLIGICFVYLSASTSAAHAAAPTFTLQSIRGRVETQTGGKGAWTAIGRGAHAVSVGDHVRTGSGSSVHIVTDDGERIALGPKTEVVLREPNRPRGWRVILGRAMAFVTGAHGLEVRTPSAIAAVEGTTFQVDVSEDGTTVLTVVEGAVRFHNDLGSVIVLSSQQSTAQVGQPPTRPIVVDPSSLTAWEASLQTLIISLEYTLVSTDPEQLRQELARRQEAVAQHADDPAAHADFAVVLIDLHRTEEAISHGQRAVDLAPEQMHFHGVLAYALLQAGRPAEAGEQFALASRAEPDDAGWQIGSALVALGEGHAESAVASLRRAAQLALRDAAPRAYLAAAYLRAGDLVQAATAASEAVSLDPNNTLANTYLTYVRLAQSNTDDAVSAAQKAVQTGPQSGLAHEALGTALTFAGQFPTAGRELDRALQLNPLSAGSHLARAKLLAAEGELDAALRDAQVAVGLDPQSAPARSTLGLLFLLNKDPGRAGHQFQQALVLSPSLSEAHTGWGKVLSARGRFREALEQQKLAVSLDTDSAAAQNNLGGIEASLGHMEQAREYLARAIQLQPGWGMPYANLAILYLEQNRLREALDTGEKAVALGERSAFAHTVLARIYMKQGRTDRAFSELRYAVALDDQYPQAHFQLAQLYLGQDRSRDAVREILTSVTVDPSAMLETRLYARTENTLAGGSFGQVHYDARHSDQAADGRLSYFVSGLLDKDDGFRPVNQGTSEKFLEVIAGEQSQPTQQFVFFGTFLDRDSGLPGVATAHSPGDPDDRQSFTGYDTVLAFRQRLSRGMTGTLKYSSRWTDLRFRNPDSLTSGDDNPFRALTDKGAQNSPEVRLDAAINERSSLSLGYAHLSNTTRDNSVVSLFDPASGEFMPGTVATRNAPATDTAWLEMRSRVNDRFDLTLGEYWGRESGSPRALSPKVVALYRPDRSTWWALVVNPLFRSDASELAPVEALADPKKLSFLNFSGGGVGHSYELQYQRQGSRARTVTTSLVYQQVRDLLVDIEDPALTGLPSRVLLDRGHRWVADAAYEQWLTATLTGRAWVRWQSSRGDFPNLQASDTEWPYSPEWQTGGRLDYINAHGLRIGLEATSIGRRFGDPKNTQRVDGYVLLNLRVQYQRNIHENYFVSVTNLTGQDYETFAGFPQAGRAVLAGLEYRY